MKPISDFINKIHQGNNLDILKEMPSNSIDSIITDPPAGISFMGKHWDSDKGGRDVWIKWLSDVFIESKRVLKPGGHALVWSLPRTSHWTGMALEDAGFEVRDKIFDLLSANNIYNDFMLSLNLEQQKMWGLILESLSPSAIEHIFGSGFPKSLDISKSIESKLILGSCHNTQFKNLDGEKGISQLGYRTMDFENDNRPSNYNGQQYNKIVNLTTPEAKQWSGWGTGLKPAVECWWLVRKPISEPTVAENVLKYGTGGINIDECRIPTDGRPLREVHDLREDVDYSGNSLAGRLDGSLKSSKAVGSTIQGRFPANIIHDGSDEVLKEFPITSSGKAEIGTGREGNFTKGIYGAKSSKITSCYADTGTAARFFYCAKPSRAERDNGLEDMEEQQIDTGRKEGNPGGDNPRNRGVLKRANNHPTVKSQALMEYLIKLIAPPNGIVLDMFAGSGSTLIAAKKLGCQYIGIEIEPNYCKIAELRIANVRSEKSISQVTPMARTEAL